MHYDFHFLNGETNTEILANLFTTMFTRQGASQFGGIIILLLQVPGGETDSDLEQRDCLVLT